MASEKTHKRGKILGIKKYDCPKHGEIGWNGYYWIRTDSGREARYCLECYFDFLSAGMSPLERKET